LFHFFQSNGSLQAAGNEKKKKSLFKKFAFMKNKDQSGSEEVSADERELFPLDISTSCLFVSYYLLSFHLKIK